MKSIILAVDTGISSICCTAYEYHGLGQFCLNQKWLIAEMIDGGSITTQFVSAVKGVSHMIPISAVISNTGNIRINEVILAIDTCIDETLRNLRQHLSDSCYQVVAIGFTTFVMNLVAVDIYGDPVGDAATCSYTCSREDVVNECHRLRE